ncbi:MAG: cyclic pyranopterin monophosphate synthase MoaC [Rickettsiales bacterium]|nr:cyclic pyranopterin monophosphate synthase MoaC [Rickettsiales bacterium]RPG16221.1 MAG: cyclic pyranopterin monophosphate synthase MoaC [Pelagibacteraceae bacterium TMED195]|tara:strand:- start:938 stop:1408 length:471 start_codon:yes stop_codon:yes gene_type:complete
MTFSHLKNNKISMVDISKKKLTNRAAMATLSLNFSEKTFKKIINNNSPKGEIFNIARSAGISAAKKTSELIPLCHNLPISFIDIDFKVDKKNLSVQILSEIKTQFSTGVEMEALTACSIAGLVIYDMCKSLDKKIIMSELKLLSKKGGKSGTFKND